MAYRNHNWYIDSCNTLGYSYLSPYSKYNVSDKEQYYMADIPKLNYIK